MNEHTHSVQFCYRKRSRLQLWYLNTGEDAGKAQCDEHSGPTEVGRDCIQLRGKRTIIVNIKRPLCTFVGLTQQLLDLENTYTSSVRNSRCFLLHDLAVVILHVYIMKTLQRRSSSSATELCYMGRQGACVQRCNTWIAHGW